MIVTGAEIILFCGISGAAAALGWFAARLTHDSQGSDQGQFSAPSWSFGGKDPRRERKSDRDESQQRYVAVIKFPSFHSFRQRSGDAPANATLSDCANQLERASGELSVSRLGPDTIECTLGAGSEDEAIGIMLDALDILRQHGEGSVSEYLDEPRAGLVAVGSLPASQSAFDTAFQAVESAKNTQRQVFVADAFESFGGFTSSADIVWSLRKALEAGEVALAYQPKLDVRDNTFKTAEALFRWDSEERRQLTVGELIISAEQHGAIEDLTLWSLKQAVSDQLELLDRGHEITTFVNLSGTLISDSEFTLKAIEIIKGATGRIGLEITETSVIEHSGHALANLELFSAAGAEIAIDDYGTGLSSLRYLKRIPAQELKIDREFIKDLTSSHRDPMIVRSTIDLAHALGLKVTAEGVDDATKLALLKVMGCDQLQGFFIAKPMPLTALIEFLGDTERQKSIVNPGVSLLPGNTAAKHG